MHRHGLTRQAGEVDAELAHRALACEVVAEAARAQMLADWTTAEAGAGRTSGIDGRARPAGWRSRQPGDDRAQDDTSAESGPPDDD